MSCWVTVELGLPFGFLTPVQCVSALNGIAVWGQQYGRSSPRVAPGEGWSGGPQMPMF